MTAAGRVLWITCGSILALTAEDRDARQPVVHVSGGMIRGAGNAPAGAAFKGIPFANPPAGDLRWREPQPVAEWKGVRDATRFGPACVQNPFGTAVFLAPMAKLYGIDYPQRKIDMSEDCLYLNVWIPEWPPARAAPVMVWIHGGSIIMGSGAEESYDGPGRVPAHVT
jgi:para-nitrobenzyl esterase